MMLNYFPDWQIVCYLGAITEWRNLRDMVSYNDECLRLAQKEEITMYYEVKNEYENS